MKTPQQHFDSAYVDIKSDNLIIHNVLVSKDSCVLYNKQNDMEFLLSCLIRCAHSWVINF